MSALRDHAWKSKYHSDAGFEENPGTYELWSPGSPLFPARDATPPPAEDVAPPTALFELTLSQV
jgi:hypothetical protein